MTLCLSVWPAWGIGSGHSAHSPPGWRNSGTEPAVCPGGWRCVCLWRVPELYYLPKDFIKMLSRLETWFWINWVHTMCSMYINLVFRTAKSIFKKSKRWRCLSVFLPCDRCLKSDLLYCFWSLKCPIMVSDGLKSQNNRSNIIHNTQSVDSLII